MTLLSIYTGWGAILSGYMAPANGLSWPAWGLCVLAVLAFTKWFSKDFVHQKGKIFPSREPFDPFEASKKGAFTSLYVSPNFKSAAPATGIVGAPEVDLPNPFEAFDRVIYHPQGCQYIVLLGDAGMGKSSFIQRYRQWHRHRHRFFRRGDIVILYLGHPEVDQQIAITGRYRPPETVVLFLDALNEDPRAAADPAARLHQLMEKTRRFARVIFTDRVRSFPSHREAVPGSGVFRLVRGQTVDPERYEFHKYLLQPFTEQQVTEYLRRRFSRSQIMKRPAARQLVTRLSGLAIAPIYLNYIEELLAADLPLTHAFEVYEAIIDVATHREVREIRGISYPAWRNFLELLAVDIYINRVRRMGEHISRPELHTLARESGLDLKNWRPAPKSLLVRTEGDNYAFVHRAFMEYFFFHQFLKGNPQCCHLSWSDQMQFFLWEHLRKTIQEDREPIVLDPGGADLSLFQVRLRATPLQDNVLQDLHWDSETPEEMLRRYNFFDRRCHPAGKGLNHLYEPREIGYFDVIVDHATALMWLPSGTETAVSLADAQRHIARLNFHRYAGFSDWRLPTTEEAMSLMAPQPRDFLHIHAFFSQRQRSIWTADQTGSRVWVADYLNGTLDTALPEQKHYVRAVRRAYDTAT